MNINYPDYNFFYVSKLCRLYGMKNKDLSAVSIRLPSYCTGF